MKGKGNSSIKYTNGKVRKDDGTITQNTFRKRVIKGLKMINRVSMKIGRISANKNPHQPMKTYQGFAELDSHAETSCLGSTFVPIFYTGEECDVSPYLTE